MKTKIIFIILCFLSLNVMGQGIITRNKKPKTTQTQPTKTHRQAQGKLKTKTASKPKPVSEPEAAGYDVTFSCNVSSATLYIDGNANGNASGTRFLKTGSHDIKVTAEGYKDYEKSISVNRQNTSCHIVFEKASKIKTLSLNDFFPIKGLTLGKTTWDEAERLGFKVNAYDGGPSRVTHFSNGADWWDHKGEGVFTSIYTTRSEAMFPLWENLGMSWDLSWNEWLQFFKSHGFSVKITKEPVTKTYQERNTLSGEFSATSSDGSIGFRLNFNYGNDNGEGYSVTSKKSLYGITIESVILEKASKVKTLSLNDFFPIEGITLGKTTWKDAERLGFKVKRFDGGPDRTSDLSNGADLWDHRGEGVFTSIYMTTYIAMFPLWENLGMSWELSWNEWLQFFKSHGFSVKITKEPVTKTYQGRNTLSGMFTATSSDGSISFRLDFDYGNDNGEGYSVTSKKSLYSITIDSR